MIKPPSIKRGIHKKEAHWKNLEIRTKRRRKMIFEKIVKVELNDAEKRILEKKVE